MLNLPFSCRLSLIALTLATLSACNSLKPKSNADAIIDPLTDSSADEYQKVSSNPENLEEKIAEQVDPDSVHADIWDRIRDGYGLPAVDNAHIDTHLLWYSRNQAHIDRFTERSQRYLHHVVTEMEANKMPLELALLPIIESSYDPFAYSRSKAAGLWQFIPGTGRNFGLKQNWWYDGRRDILASTDAAIRYLQRLNTMFDGDWFLALAAYNAGEGRVSRAIEKNRKAGKPTDFWSLSLPKETRAYVPRLIALSKIIATPEAYQLTLNSIPNDPYFTRVNVGSQIDLMQAARLAEIDVKELQSLNAGNSRWLTDPSGDHHLLVPVADAANFTTQLNQLPKLPPISWAEHKVAKGDVLGSIARRHNTSVDAIKTVNRLKNNNIRVGQVLLVPNATIATSGHASSEDLMQNYGKKTGSRYTQTYAVRSGDSLWKIANRHKTSVEKLARLNGISTRSKLKPGQKLLISGAPAPASTSIAKTTNATENGLQKMTYHIQRGDTLYSIANRFSLSTHDILAWNSVKDARYIHPGQALTLYVAPSAMN